MLNLTPSSSALFICAILIAFITLLLIKFSFLYRAPKTETADHRFSQLDGLRGYLAFFVFLHHTYVWYYFLKLGVWKSPTNVFYKNLGEASVVVFFMITGFLFSQKITKEKNHINWIKLYKSRVQRLAPLYWFVLSLLIMTTLIVSNFNIIGSLTHFFKNIFYWFIFNLFTDTSKININGFKGTHLMLAGVTWTLKYEWLFYLSLPAYTIFSAGKKNYLWVMLGFISLYFLLVTCIKDNKLELMLAFFCGALANYTLSFSKFKQLSKTFTTSCLVAILLIAVFFLQQQAFSAFTILLLGFVFILISAGCSIFGILQHRLSIQLGEISYSIYLLHGLILFLCFYFIIGLERAALLTELEYACVILLITPVLLICASITHRLVERTH